MITISWFALWSDFRIGNLWMVVTSGVSIIQMYEKQTVAISKAVKKVGGFTVTRISQICALRTHIHTKIMRSWRVSSLKHFKKQWEEWRFWILSFFFYKNQKNFITVGIKKTFRIMFVENCHFKVKSYDF